MARYFPTTRALRSRADGPPMRCNACLSSRSPCTHSTPGVPHTVCMMSIPSAAPRSLRANPKSASLMWVMSPGSASSRFFSFTSRWTTPLAQGGGVGEPWEVKVCVRWWGVKGPGGCRGRPEGGPWGPAKTAFAAEIPGFSGIQRIPGSCSAGVGGGARRTACWGRQEGAGRAPPPSLGVQVLYRLDELAEDGAGGGFAVVALHPPGRLPCTWCPAHKSASAANTTDSIHFPHCPHPCRPCPPHHPIQHLQTYAHTLTLALTRAHAHPSPRPQPCSPPPAAPPAAPPPSAAP